MKMKEITSLYLKSYEISLYQLKIRIDTSKKEKYNRNVNKNVKNNNYIIARFKLIIGGVKFSGRLIEKNTSESINIK